MTDTRDGRRPLRQKDAIGIGSSKNECTYSPCFLLWKIPKLFKTTEAVGIGIVENYESSPKQGGI